MWLDAVMPIEFDATDDFAREMQTRAEEMLFEQDLASEEGMDIATPSGAPWCGCTTCVVRETLTLGVQLLAAGIEQGHVSIATSEENNDRHQLEIPGLLDT
jgi:hypothetical protein